MKRYLLYTYSLLLFSSCLTVKEEECYAIKSDKEYPFLNAIKRQYNFNYLNLITDTKEFGTNTNFHDTAWLRNEEHLKSCYASIKSLGLKKFISDKQFNKPLFTAHYKKSIWENHSIKDIIEGLINSYQNNESQEIYYDKFWERRKHEKNEKTVFIILNDIYAHYSGKKGEFEIKWKPNHLISALLSYDYKLNTSKEIDFNLYQEYYNYLDSIELHTSAHNLIQFILNHKKLDKNTIHQLEVLDIKNIIKNKKIDCNDYKNERYSAKWFTPLYDEGP